LEGLGVTEGVPFTRRHEEIFLMDDGKYLDCGGVYKTASICQNSQNMYTNTGEFYSMSIKTGQCLTAFWC